MAYQLAVLLLAEATGIEPASQLSPALRFQRSGLAGAQRLHEARLDGSGSRAKSQRSSPTISDQFLEETARIGLAPRFRVDRFQGGAARQLPSSPCGRIFSAERRFPLPSPGTFTWARFFLEEGGGVAPPRPLSEPTPVRAERTCSCTNPSRLSLVPADGSAPSLSAYETDVILVRPGWRILVEFFPYIPPLGPGNRDLHSPGLCFFGAGDRSCTGICPLTRRGLCC